MLSGAKGLDDILAAAAGLPVESMSRSDLDHLTDGAPHQGVVLEADPLPLLSLKEWLQGLDEGPCFVAVLDGIEDPHNFGAIVRSAAAFGAAGVLFAKDRAAPLSITAVKSAAGGFEYVPLMQETNLTRALSMLKDAGFWVLGLDADGGQPLWQSSLPAKCALIIGSEGKGMRRLVAEHCDLLMHIPMPGKITALNASVSAGIAFAEVARQQAR